MSAHEIVGSFVGVGASRVGDLFEHAKAEPNSSKPTGWSKRRGLVLSLP